MKLGKIHPVAVAIVLLAAAMARGDSARFAVVGDTRGTDSEAINEDVFTQIIDSTLKADPPVQFVVVPGDLVTGSEFDPIVLMEFARWRQLAAPWYQSEMLGLKVYPVPGNHDLSNVIFYGGPWRIAFPELPTNGPAGEKKLTYSFDIGPCHLTVINTSSPVFGHRTNLDWLEQDLAASDAPVKLVFGHEPAFPKAGHICSSLDAFPDLQKQFWKILADNGVQAYFCGHEHTYDHWASDGVHQIITGGGGAPGNFLHYLIVDADESDVTVSVYRPSGELLEQYKLSDPPVIADDDPRPRPDCTVNESTGCVPIFAIVFFVTAMGFAAICRFDEGIHPL
jgi:hypothetical protein